MKCRRRLHDERTRRIQEGNVDSRKGPPSGILCPPEGLCSRSDAVIQPDGERLRFLDFPVSEAGQISSHSHFHFHFRRSRTEAGESAGSCHFRSCVEHGVSVSAEAVSAESRDPDHVASAGTSVEQAVISGSHPHPQFVAAKSTNRYTFHDMCLSCIWLQRKIKQFFYRNVQCIGNVKQKIQ